jgi:hypothetical protein
MPHYRIRQINHSTDTAGHFTHNNNGKTHVMKVHIFICCWNSLAQLQCSRVGRFSVYTTDRLLYTLFTNTHRCPPYIFSRRCDHRLSVWVFHCTDHRVQIKYDRVNTNRSDIITDQWSPALPVSPHVDTFHLEFEFLQTQLTERSTQVSLTSVVLITCAGGQ